VGLLKTWSGTTNDPYPVPVRQLGKTVSNMDVSWAANRLET
jgi:hypothetical protein